MRRSAALAALISLPGCTGFGQFLDHTFTLPGTNPNIPMADSENIRRALGRNPDVQPLTPEPGNVWPGPQAPEPTLGDIASQPGTEDRRGFPPTDTGATPNYPAGRQPRPLGSSTPPGSVQPGPASVATPQTPPQPGSSVPSAGPTGQVVPTPEGPAVDVGGTRSYRQINGPRSPGAIMVPNGNGTSTIINPDGSVQTIITPR